MGLIKHILFHNFWSFLFVLSGFVDLGIGVVSYLTGTFTAKNSPLPTFTICFMIGGVYLSAGISLAIVKMRRHNSLN
jgi:hypothetical protein